MDRSAISSGDSLADSLAIILSDRIQYNDCCLKVLQTIPKLSVFDRDARLLFGLREERHGLYGKVVPCTGRFVFRYDLLGNFPRGEPILELCLDGVFLQSFPHDVRIQNLEMETNTSELKRFAEIHLKNVYEQGYSISEGKIVISRYLPRELVDSGAGYDWIPDEDDYEETTLSISPLLLEIRLAKCMPSNHKAMVRKWIQSIPF